MKQFFLQMICWLLLPTSAGFALNNDGKPDLLWRNYSTAADDGWLMNNASQIGTVTLPSAVDVNWKMVGTGDFNYDRQLDILWYHVTTGQIAFWYMNASTYLSSAILGVTQTDLNWKIVGTGYFGGVNDRKIDILWRHGTTGQNAVWHLDGTTLSLGQLIQAEADLNWTIAGAGDFNLDGNYDILWRNYADGRMAIWWLHNGTSFLRSDLIIVTQQDANWDIVGTGYFDADAHYDIAWRHRTLGNNAIWYMNVITFVSASLTSPINREVNWKIGAIGDSKEDADRDSMADLWERHYFGTLSRTGSADWDADGISDLQEYQNGSNPSELKMKISRPRPGSRIP